MLTDTPLPDRPRDCLAATGRTHEAFLRGLPACGAASTACDPLAKPWPGPVRQRPWGGGANGRWAPVADPWLCLLVSPQPPPATPARLALWAASAPDARR